MNDAALNEHGWLAKLSKLTVAVAGVALVGIGVVEGWQVFARYVLNKSPSWTEPIALLSMSTAMMCAAAAGVRSSRHFGFFMIVEHASPIVRRTLRFVALLIAAFIGGIFCIAGAHLVAESWDFPMAGAPLPQGAVYLPICIGGLLIAVFAMERLVLLWRSRSGPPPATHNS